MKKITTLLTAFLFALNSNATLITVELDKTNVNVGDTITADIIISDIELDAGFQKLVASFEFDVMFDDSLLGFVSATFGSKLDVDPFFASDQYIDSFFSGSVYLSEISYAWSSDLYDAQDALASFVLASVDFNVIGAGAGTVGLSNSFIGDDVGGAIEPVTQTGQDFIVSNDNPVNVPEPSTFLLMLMAAAGFVSQRKAR